MRTNLTSKRKQTNIWVCLNLNMQFPPWEDLANYIYSHPQAVVDLKRWAMGFTQASQHPTHPEFPIWSPFWFPGEFGLSPPRQLSISTVLSLHIAPSWSCCPIPFLSPNILTATVDQGPPLVKCSETVWCQWSAQSKSTTTEWLLSYVCTRLIREHKNYFCTNNLCKLIVQIKPQMIATYIRI